MLQISGMLELRSHQLRCDALKLMNATICGSATTDFWHLMENYFGTDEDIDKASLDEAQSLADILKLKKQWSKEDVPSISKSSVKPDDDITIIDDEEDDRSSVSSSLTTKLVSSTTSSLQTLAQKKKATEDKFPNFCSLKEASLFYPTNEKNMHTMGINPAHISERMKIGVYKGFYCCFLHKDCQYVAQTNGLIATHICHVHVGHALRCRFCPTLAWWQACYWSDNMVKKHSDQPKFKVLVFPEGTIKAEEIDPSQHANLDHFVVQETFPFTPTQPPVPIHHMEPKQEVVEVHTSSKKRDAESSDSSSKKGKFIGSVLKEILEDA